MNCNILFDQPVGPAFRVMLYTEHGKPCIRQFQAQLRFRVEYVLESFGSQDASCRRVRKRFVTHIASSDQYPSMFQYPPHLSETGRPVRSGDHVKAIAVEDDVELAILKHLHVCQICHHKLRR